MSWMNTTRWLDKSKNDLEEICKSLLKKDGKDLVPSDKRENLSYFNVKIKLTSTDTDFPGIKGKIEYKAFEGTFERGKVKGQLENSLINFHLVLYKVEEDIFIVINRNADASTIIRRLLGYKQKNELESSQFKLNNSLFLWTVEKVFNDDEGELSYTTSNQSELSLLINNVTGIKGETPQSNKLTASGNTIVKLLSTLSLLLEVNKLRQIQVEIEMVKHEQLFIKLQKDGVIGFEQLDYSGEFENDPQSVRSTKLILLIYETIMPIIMTEYKTDVDENIWNDKKVEKFIDDIKQLLITKVDAIKGEIDASLSGNLVEK